jgi:hypothetical protein
MTPEIELLLKDCRLFIRAVGYSRVSPEVGKNAVSLRERIDRVLHIASGFEAKKQDDGTWSI